MSVKILYFDICVVVKRTKEMTIQGIFWLVSVIHSLNCYGIISLQYVRNAILEFDWSGDKNEWIKNYSKKIVLIKEINFMQ